jgi:hypothetical protein
MQAKLLFHTTDNDAVAGFGGSAGRHQKETKAPQAGLIGLATGEHQMTYAFGERVICERDPNLFADNPPDPVVALMGTGSNAPDVRAGAWLGHADRRPPFTSR